MSGGTDLDRGRVSQPTTAQKMRVVLAVLPFNMCVHLLKCADTVNADASTLRVRNFAKHDTMHALLHAALQTC